MIVLGVDIGGTKIAAGRVNLRGEVESFAVTPTRAADGYETSIQQVWRALEGGLTKDVKRIGLCAPGPLNAKTGMVLNPPNLPGWRDVPLARLAQEKFGLPVSVENDCNAAGLAEALHGAGRGHSSVFYTAIGTGIGSGIILNGKIYHGAHGAAGEAGHVTIDYRSPIPCGCGTPGCIEALARNVEIDELAERLSAWLGNMLSLLDPGIVVIGGGVSQMGEPLFARLRAAAPRWTINPHAREIPIVPGELGAHAGVIGAAAVAL